MKLGFFSFLILLSLTYCGEPTFADNPPPARLCSLGYAAPCQANVDLFQYNGKDLDLSATNPVKQKAMTTGQVKWAYKVESGCIEGGISRNIGAAMGDLWYNTGVASVYVTDGTQDLTIHINCGTSFAAICGGGSVIGCLGRGFPYNLDIDLSDGMADFYDLSQISIVCHEYCGHALVTWNEQYLLNGNFSANPGWVDVMNTGIDSRHYLAGIELARWQRTMGTPELTTYGSGANGSGFYLYACNIDQKATRLSILYSDGNGPLYWSGVLAPVKRDANGCQGIGELEGIQVQGDRHYWLKQENLASLWTNHNEVMVK